MKLRPHSTFIPRQTPRFDDNTSFYFGIDVRNIDCSQLDLSAYNAQHFTFDYKTVWPTDPAKMPKDFDPQAIMELHKNPGLGIHELHKRGLTGKGLSIAIIDQLLADHKEYHDNLVHYEEIGYDDPRCSSKAGAMHGSAVASLAVGKTCGVAPDAKLYYFAANTRVDANNNLIPYEKGKVSSHNFARAVERIIDINTELIKKGEKPIQVVSISTGWMAEADKTGEWAKAVKHAQQTGLVILDSCWFIDYPHMLDGLGQKYNGDPDKPESYDLWFRTKPKHKNPLCGQEVAFPMNHRTTASPYSSTGYAHYNAGGFSWKTPYVAGLFLLARQVNPNVTAKHFYETALKTSSPTADGIGRIANPVRLINALQKEHLRSLRRTTNKTQIKSSRGYKGSKLLKKLAKSVRKRPVRRPQNTPSP